jgi:hypothetical protein
MGVLMIAADFWWVARWGWFAEGRFLGRVLDEWTVDAQEFVHTILRAKDARRMGHPRLWRNWPRKKRRR